MKQWVLVILFITYILPQPWSQQVVVSKQIPSSIQWDLSAIFHLTSSFAFHHLSSPSFFWSLQDFPKIGWGQYLVDYLFCTCQSVSGAILGRDTQVFHDHKRSSWLLVRSALLSVRWNTLRKLKFRLLAWYLSALKNGEHFKSNNSFFFWYFFWYHPLFATANCYLNVTSYTSSDKKYQYKKIVIFP